MSFRLPQFNLVCDIWVGTNTPFADAPFYTGKTCQKYINSRPQVDTTPPYQNKSWVEWCPAVVFRFPRTIPPFDDVWSNWNVGVIMCPAGSGQCYRAAFQDIMHEGFPNEYAIVLCVQCDQQGKAIQPNSTNATTGYGQIMG